jgi:Family of unknown function (DUF6205)
MSYSNRFSGAISITPPLTAPELRSFTACYDWDDSFDAHLRVTETTEETADGEIVRREADAIVGPEESCNGYDVQEQIQTVVDLYPDRVFAGFIQADWDQGFGDPPSRYVVRDGRVVEVKAQYAWPEEPAPQRPHTLQGSIDGLRNFEAQQVADRRAAEEGGA